MPKLENLTLGQLAVIAAWITKNYDIKTDPETTSKTKMLQIFNQLPVDVIDDAIKSLNFVQSNPIRVTRMTSEMLISEGSDNLEEELEYDQDNFGDEELITCANCEEEFILLDSQAEEVDCPECDSHLVLSSIDDEEIDEDCSYSSDEEE